MTAARYHGLFARKESNEEAERASALADGQPGVIRICCTEEADAMARSGRREEAVLRKDVSVRGT